MKIHPRKTELYEVDISFDEVIKMLTDTMRKNGDLQAGDKVEHEIIGESTYEPVTGNMTEFQPTAIRLVWKRVPQNGK